MSLCDIQHAIHSIDLATTQVKPASIDMLNDPRRF